MLDGEAIQALRKALEFSPNNLPLRQHLAESLLGLDRTEEAASEFRQALNLAPDDYHLKLGLATAFYRLGKPAPSLVIVEDLAYRTVADVRAMARTALLHTRLLIDREEPVAASQQYRRAIELDPSVADSDLAKRLAVGTRISPLGAIAQTGACPTVDDGISGADPSIERPRISFRDVGGMDAVKEEIRMRIVFPLTNPDLYRAYGKRAGGGLLLYGPPGCGKTFLARATAGEIDARFIIVEIHEVLEMWLGQSERNLHEIFDRARRNKPCVLFIDEVDALGASRSDLRQSAGRHLINQFLAELDGVHNANDGVLVLAATNAPWHLDPAFRRPGRFDRIVFVPPPDASARAAILRLLVEGKPVEEIDFTQLTKRTDGFSGADLKAIVDLAIDQKLREAMRDGRPRQLTTRDLLSAASTIKPSTGAWFATARNYVLYANPGGIYDDIRTHLKL